MKLEFGELLDRYRSLKESQRHLALSIALSLVVAVNIVFLLSPLLGQATWLSAEVMRLSSELELISRNVSEMKGLHRRLAEIEAEIAELDRRVVRGDMTPFLKSLSEIAHGTGVQILKLVPLTDMGRDKPVATLEGYRETGFQIQAESGYHDLGKFLEKLENHPIFIEVSDLEILANLLKPMQHRISLNVRMIQKDIDSTAPSKPSV